MGNREMIAKNVAAMLHDGDVVNLGIGIPTLVSNYVPENVTVWLHGENGCIGIGKELPCSRLTTGTVLRTGSDYMVMTVETGVRDTVTSTIPGTH